MPLCDIIVLKGSKGNAIILSENFISFLRVGVSYGVEICEFENKL